MAFSTIDTEASGVRPRTSAGVRPQSRVASPFTLPPVEQDRPAPRPPAQATRGASAQPSAGQGTDPARPKVAERTPRREPAPAGAERKPEVSKAKPDRAQGADASRDRSEPIGQAAGGSEPVSKTPAAPAEPAPAAVVDAALAAEARTKVAESSEEVEEGSESETQDAAPTPLPFLAVTAQTPPPVVPGLTPSPPPGQGTTSADPAVPPAGAEAVTEGAAPAAPLALRVQARSGRGEASEGEGQAKADGDGSALPPAAQASTDAPVLTDLLPAPTPTAHARTAETAAPASTHSAATVGASVPVPLGAVPMTIGLRALSGSNNFEIRLDPKDLGRIEVNLAIDTETNTVQATLRVDRPETLALLQRDAGSLQQALSQAGLDVPEGGISLSLRSDSGAGGGGSGSGEQPPGPPARTGREDAGDRPLPPALPLRLYGGGRGLDIRI